jgi:thiamine pyrophosphokinase
MTSFQKNPDLELDTVMATLPDAPLMIADGPVVLIGNGEVDPQQLLFHQHQKPIIAVDGGANLAHALGLDMEWAIGDFDSAHPNSLQAARHRLQIQDQNSTDLQKALAILSAPLVLAFGFLGKRFDHSLAALHAMAGARPMMRVVMISADDTLVFCRGDFHAVLPPSSRLSVWPLYQHRFTASQGLLYPLDGLALGTGLTLGTSNQVITGDQDISVRIASESGDGYFVLIDGRLADRLLRLSPDDQG